MRVNNRSCRDAIPSLAVISLVGFSCQHEAGTIALHGCIGFSAQSAQLWCVCMPHARVLMQHVCINK